MTQEIPIDQNLMAWQGPGGSARALWDEKNLYVLVTVTRAELNKANPSAHEQDSIEIFLDEGNHKSSYFQNDDGQYRINFDNEQSFNPSNIARGFESRTFISGSSFTVISKIPFRTITPKEDSVLGFDLQINGASARGMRQSVTIWNDLSGNGWQDPSLYGLLKLVR
jgi:endo-1,4-beta-xylanase